MGVLMKTIGPKGINIRDLQGNGLAKYTRIMKSVFDKPNTHTEIPVSFTVFTRVWEDGNVSPGIWGPTHYELWNISKPKKAV